MRKPFRQLSALLLVAALAVTVTLLVLDASNHLRLTFAHQRTGALCFILIGASYVSLLLSVRRPWREKLKGILLGIGFLFWGGEQFLQPGPLVTVMDSAVVMIFVADLSLIIIGWLQHKEDGGI
jgi:peptidoglycan/LPS O-acetylase OafA/YrhL